MKLSKQKYDKIYKKKAPRSSIFSNSIKAFITGGIICAIGQGLLNLYISLGLNKEDASTLVTASLIFASAFLTGLNVYDKIAKFGGAGSLVPVTGFSNAMVSPAMEFKSEGLITGLGAKMFNIAGPVLVYGISASVLYGIILAIIR